MNRFSATKTTIAALVFAFAWQTPAVRSQTQPEKSTFRLSSYRDKTYTKYAELALPFSLNDASRNKVKVVWLFAKHGANQWQKHAEAVAPNADDRFGRFDFAAPNDGEYWFSVLTVDAEGKPSRDPANLTPDLRVVVDTKPPVIDAEVVSVGNVPMLRVKITDDNPDPSSLRVVAKLDTGDQPLVHPPGRLEYRLSPRQLASTIHITVADLSGNVATRIMVPKTLP